MPQVKKELYGNDYIEGESGKYVIEKNKAGHMKVLKSGESVLTFRAKPQARKDGPLGIPYNDWAGLLTFFLIYYGLLTGLFILTHLWNEASKDDRQWENEWAFLGMFLFTAVCIAIASVAGQYEGSGAAGGGHADAQRRRAAHE